MQKAQVQGMLAESLVCKKVLGDDCKLNPDKCYGEMCNPQIHGLVSNPGGADQDGELHEVRVYLCMRGCRLCR